MKPVDVEQIEKVLKGNYGVIPNVISNATNLTIINEYRKKMGLKGIINGIAMLALKSTIPIGGMYVQDLHTIFMEINENNDEYRFNLRHEFVHGYEGQRNSSLRYELSTLLSSILRGEISKEYFEREFLKKAVKEGVANYLAIESFKTDNDYNEFSTNKFLAETEYGLATNKKGLSDGKVVLDPIMFEFRLENCRKHIAMIDMSDNVNNKMNMKQKIQISKDLFLKTYDLGYSIVRAACESLPGSLQENLDSIIQHPPQTLDQVKPLIISTWERFLDK